MVERSNVFSQMIRMEMTIILMNLTLINTFSSLDRKNNAKRFYASMPQVHGGKISIIFAHRIIYDHLCLFSVCFLFGSIRRHLLHPIQTLFVSKLKQQFPQTFEYWNEALLHEVTQK